VLLLKKRILNEEKIELCEKIAKEVLMRREKLAKKEREENIHKI